MRPRISTDRVILASAVFVTAFANLAFFRNLLATFGGDGTGYAHVASLGGVLLSLTIIVLALLSLTRLTRPLFMAFFVVSAVSAYFMDTYNVIIDHEMVANVVETDAAEARDLLTPRLLVYLLLLGIVPSVLLVWVDIRPESVLQLLRRRATLAAAASLVAVGLVLLSSGFYASFVREHKALRYYANPLTPVYGAVRSARLRFAGGTAPLQELGTDARIPVSDPDRELVIMVVGETARSDRFSLNGYPRETNPRLARAGVASLGNMSSCGTSTAVSVPCMFAIYGRDDFGRDKARSTENLLDILQHAGVHVLWRDNNSDSKGVAERVPFQDYRSPAVNPVCDSECRDEGMLEGLQAFIDAQADGDILIVLHQMGSHGPAYHKRYPARFGVFRPTCESSQLDACTAEEVGNSYDNSILYTDYFLDRVTGLLRANDDAFETAMVYVSDHGESLGENGLYLHGLPYMIAPDSQTRVASVFWFGENFHGGDVAAMRRLAQREYSHDNIFHTLLGLFEVESAVYDPGYDLLRQAAQSAGRDG